MTLKSSPTVSIYMFSTAENVYLKGVDYMGCNLGDALI